VSLYGILPGDWNDRPASLEIGSRPVPATSVVRAMPVSARGQRNEHRALPVRPGEQLAAPPGARRASVE
jgi:hypothetical protein